MKHVPGTVKDKYEILGVIGEGRKIFLFSIYHNFIYNLKKGSYGVVVKARKKVLKIILINQYNKVYCLYFRIQIQ